MVVTSSLICSSVSSHSGLICRMKEIKEVLHFVLENIVIDRSYLGHKSYYRHHQCLLQIRLHRPLHRNMWIICCFLLQENINSDDTLTVCISINGCLIWFFCILGRWTHWSLDIYPWKVVIIFLKMDACFILFVSHICNWEYYLLSSLLVVLEILDHLWLWCP